VNRLDVFLEAATENDLAELRVLEQRSFSHPWSEQSFRGALEDRQTLVLVLRASSSRAILAYGVFQVVADEFHIHDLAVVPEQRQRGLGRQLLSQALDLGARRGARAAHLEVRESNRAALALYRSLGFRTAGVRRGYYESPPEDALVLSKESLATAVRRTPSRD
jgi:ribosomal-protein-alanine N-acetyltransferase